MTASCKEIRGGSSWRKTIIITEKNKKQIHELKWFQSFFKKGNIHIITNYLQKLMKILNLDKNIETMTLNTIFGTQRSNYMLLDTLNIVQTLVGSCHEKCCSSDLEHHLRNLLVFHDIIIIYELWTNLWTKSRLSFYCCLEGKKMVFRACYSTITYTLSRCSSCY